MTDSPSLPTISSLEQISTWFGVGGGCSRYAEPETIDQLRACLELDPTLRILGDGANLLVADQGVPELVVSLKRLNAATWHASGASVSLRVQAGHDLPKLIAESVRRGLAGIEVLGGIPATLGGAAIMNAGGAFGTIADTVVRVHAITRANELVTLERVDIPFGYRTSGLTDLIVTEVELALTPTDQPALRERLIEVMAYKKKSQPLKANSAGCCFKNPTLTHDIPDVGTTGQRVSAGLLIDRANIKGLRIGSAQVSEVHANFLTADKGGTARDLILLIQRVRDIVFNAFGVNLHTEVQIWGHVENPTCSNAHFAGEPNLMTLPVSTQSNSLSNPLANPISNPTIAVLVLGGGPDAEREVSLASSTQVALACEKAGFVTRREVIETITYTQLAQFISEMKVFTEVEAVVVFPVLHGGWGEGGPLQDILARAQASGLCAYVGCGPTAARLAMDKLATKLLAAQLDLPVAHAVALNPRDRVSPIPCPVVLKPVHEGSSVGVRFARTNEEFAVAVDSVREELKVHPYRTYMVENAILTSRELTVALLDGVALEPIEIIPESAFYDYHAKYQSNTTRYVVGPQLPIGVREAIQSGACALATAIGVRHLARIDFLLGSDQVARVLEANTMPGFTDHSLVPMAAKHAGMNFADLCTRIVHMALRDRTPTSNSSPRIHVQPKTSTFA